MNPITLSLFDAPATEKPKAQACPNLTKTLRTLLDYDSPTAPSNHTETSKAAAAHVLATGQAATQIAQVLSLIEQAGQEGLTRGDIAHALGLPASTICARVDTLRKAQRVQEDGRTRIPKCGGAVRQRVIVGVGL